MADTSAPPTTDVFGLLERRGFVQQCSNPEGLRQLLAAGPATFYYGMDATGQSLHAGNLVGLLAMRHLQEAGHRPIVLIGGGTARIGDPSDKDEMRKLLSVERVAANAAAITAQVGRFIDLDRTIVVDNAEWLASLHYLDFLRDIGRHFSVNRMLGFETYKRRLETGLTFLEFNYLLLQAYDYLLLNQREGCRLQIGGDDQWANILSGVDLVRRVERVEAYALTWPLITLADGSKMGKSAAGAMYLDAALVPPYDFYQYWVNVPDTDVGMLVHDHVIVGPRDVRIRDIAQQQNIPRRFLEQILNDLKSAGFVQSRRGVAGGYRLQRAPDEISLADIIRHLEGPLAPVGCVSVNYYQRCSCPDEAKCAIRSVMQEVRDAIVGALEGVTVSHLCDRVRDLQGPMDNPLDYII